MTITTRWSHEPAPDGENAQGVASRSPDGGGLLLVETPPGGDEGERGEPLQPRTVSRRYRRVTVGVAMSDALSIMVSLTGAALVAFGWRSLPSDVLVTIFAAPIAWWAAFASARLYRPQNLPAWAEFRSIVGATSVGVALLMVASVALQRREMQVVLALTWGFALLLEVVSRRLWAREVGRLRHRKELVYRTLVVGTNDEAAQLSRNLGRPGTGFEPLGYVVGSAPVGRENGAPVLGTLSELDSLIKEHRVDCLFVASSDVSSEDMGRLCRVARVGHAEVRLSTNLPDTLPSRVSVQPVGDLVTLSVSPVRLSRGQATIKRLCDVVIGSVVLVASLPLLVVVAAAVRLSSRGPILFRQERVTRGGALFQIYKFRTMRWQCKGDGLDPVGDLSAPFFKERDDPRLTRVGRFLRRYSLDEVPQLWNVVRGDISLVGPRPLWSIQVDSEDDVFRHRHEMRSGLTGWWQINGRSDVDPDQALRMDLLYIENWSLGLDLSIMLRTVGVVLRSRGAC